MDPGYLSRTIFFFIKGWRQKRGMGANDFLFHPRRKLYDNLLTSAAMTRRYETIGYEHNRKTVG